MTMNMRNSQLGLTVTGLIFISMITILVIVLGMKVVPEVVEYSKIVSEIKAVAGDPSLRQASVQEVRRLYERRAIVDQISAITPQDLEIVTSPNGPTLSFAYSKRIPLGGPVSLVIDFAGSSDK